MDGRYTRLLLLVLFTPRFVVVVAAAAQFRLRVQSQDETHTTDETDIVPVFRGSFYYLLSTMHLLVVNYDARSIPYHTIVA